MSEAVDAKGTDEIGLWDRLRWLWWVAAAVLVASLGVTAWGYLRDRRLDAATRHDNALVIATERLLSSLKDVETGVSAASSSPAKTSTWSRTAPASPP